MMSQDSQTSSPQKPFSYGYIEPVRKHPEGMRVKRLDNGIALGFWCYRKRALLWTVGYVFLALTGGTLIGIAITPDLNMGNNPIPYIFLVYAIMAGIFPFIVLIHTKVVITPDILVFGGKSFAMRYVSGISVGYSITPQTPHPGQSNFSGYRVIYGKWGEMTHLCNTSEKATAFAVFMSDCIQEVVGHSRQHDSEHGERNQVF